MNEKERATLSSNIRKTILRAIGRGTVGMSFVNLKQITPTTGLTCSVAAFHNEFDTIAAQVARLKAFTLYR